MSKATVGVKVADNIHKIVGLSLIGFTLFGTLNLFSAFDFKLRRNRKAQQLLEQETVHCRRLIFSLIQY